MPTKGVLARRSQGEVKKNGAAANATVEARVVAVHGCNDASSAGLAASSSWAVQLNLIAEKGVTTQNTTPAILTVSTHSQGLLAHTPPLCWKGTLADVYQSSVSLTVTNQSVKNSSWFTAPTTTFLNAAQESEQVVKVHSLKLGETRSITMPLYRKKPISVGATTASPEAAPSPTTTVINAVSRNSIESSTPSLTVQLKLSGPYRPELVTALRIWRTWCTLVDQAEHIVRQTVLSKIPHLDPKVWLLPLVPVAGGVAVVTPLVVGLSILCFPIALPIAVLLAVAIASVSILLAGLYASTRSGRTQIHAALRDTAGWVVGTTLGQQVVYHTGPLPTPVRLIQTILPTDPWYRLAVSLAIDAIGSGSYLIPFAGEGFDVAWAPIQTLVIMALYNDGSPNLKYVSMAEELLPFTDMLPSAITGWLLQDGCSVWNEYQQT